MINRIRDIRKIKGLTLAELAEACDPPTTAQTIGRLETGMRNLSTKWMDRIGAALEVDPQSLVRSEQQASAQIMAELGLGEVTALSSPRDAIMPSELAAQDENTAMMVLEVTHAIGEYRPGDLIWLRRVAIEDAGDAINRDCLVPRPGGRLLFGRMIDCKGTLVGVLPSQSGQKQQVVDNPDWIGIATMLVRSL